MKITPEKREELKYNHSKYIIFENFNSNKTGIDIKKECESHADYWLNVLEEETEQAYNMALDMAVEALPEVKDGRIEMPKECFDENGTLIINAKSLPIAVHNGLIDHHAINTQNRYREEAITNLNQLKGI